MNEPRAPFVRVPLGALRFFASRLTHAELLCVLAIYASSDGGRDGTIFVADTARWLGMSRRMIQEALENMDREGWITRIGNLVHINIVEVDVAEGSL